MAQGVVIAVPVISIHALRAEGDEIMAVSRPVFRISIHALRAEGDLMPSMMAFTTALFQSTPSGRRATCRAFCAGFFSTYFNPRPPGGGRLPSGIIGVFTP